MVFQVSPGVHVSEIDLTPSVPAVSVSTGAIAGYFQWGPALKVTSISNENQLANTFGDPDNNTAASFFTAANFLSYATSLIVVRASANGAKNGCANTGANNTNAAILINNEDDYFANGSYTTQQVGNPFTARYPGAMGNSLKVFVWANGAVWTANSTNTADPNYSFSKFFDFAPGTSPYIKNVTNGAVVNDEMHILVVDANGAFTGVANSILEKYQGLSKIKDALNPVGGSNYYKEVIYRKSKYVYVTGVPSANVQGFDSLTLSLPTFVPDQNVNTSILAGGVVGNVTTDSAVVNAYGILVNKDYVDISLVMTGDVSDTIRSYVALNVAAVRQDCVAFVSPPFANVTDVTGAALSISNYAANTTYRTSYAVMDSGYKYQYDKYNDVYRWIPLNGDIAGLCAATDNLRDPWWSPAGLQRGVIKNVVRLAFNPAQTDRDILYPAGVNPVVAFPGQGVILFGDKTFLNFSSAFDRINVRRLFIVLEKAISAAAKTSLFEFNDAFTRAQFVALIEPFLRTVQGRRGITDFKVVCDTTNNTPDVIDANQFVGDIYIKPNRSINYIQLNFVAVRTGVSFSTVVGQF